jgi:hypothetical protein
VRQFVLRLKEVPRRPLRGLREPLRRRHPQLFDRKQFLGPQLGAHVRATSLSRSRPR